ncbi:hypothetical protein QYF61_016709 [Mycteria americana]|uniref:Uncharacterized protein n=1 Tax=Mycteria americana TaxID=33587 RepID=A0AAN7RTF1_MYCAM|nr:hypothetical protein QYF61_016709 [Mycteria americana]
MLAGPDPLVACICLLSTLKMNRSIIFPGTEARLTGLLINDGEWLGKLLRQLPQYSQVDPIQPHRLDCLPRDSVNQWPEQGKVCPQEVPGSGFAHPPPYFATNRELCHIVVAKPKTAFNHHISHQSFSVCKQQVKRGTSPGRLTETADFPGGWIWSAYWALCSPQKRIAYDNYPPFFLTEAVVIRGTRWLTLGQGKGLESLTYG